MQIPRYWARVMRDDIAGIGWSHSSEEEARRSATERAIRVADKIARSDFELDSYPYGARDAIREMCVERFEDGQGRTTAALTRNNYGAEVLNAESLMMADLDLPEPARPASPSLIARLFGRKPAQAAPPDEHPESAAMGLVESLARSRPGMGARVYRTRAGLRVLFPDTPRSVAEAIPMLRAINTDTLYVKLCESQQCFRARLTPKPWRCGVPSPHISFPFMSPAHEATFRKWLDRYQQRSQAFATTRLVKTLGNPAIHPSLRGLVELHDTVSRSDADLPLA